MDESVVNPRIWPSPPPHATTTHTVADHHEHPSVHHRTQLLTTNDVPLQDTAQLCSSHATSPFRLVLWSRRSIHATACTVCLHCCPATQPATTPDNVAAHVRQQRRLRMCGGRDTTPPFWRRRRACAAPPRGQDGTLRDCNHIGGDVARCVIAITLVAR